MFFKHIARLSALLGLVFLFVIAGCSDDDNPVDSHDESEHFHAVGSKLMLDGTDVIVAETADSADVVGMIELHEGEEEHFQAHFLNDEGEWFYPGDDPGHHTDHELEVVIGNGDMIEAEVDGWEVHLTGMMHGNTWVRLRVKHIDHYGYTSPHLRTHVHESEGHHGPPVGMYLRDGEDNVVHVNASGEVTGAIQTPVDGSSPELEVFLYDEAGVEFQPEDDHSLGIAIEDETIAGFTSLSLWTFTIDGNAAGETGVVFSILHGDHSHFDSPSVPIVVE